MLESESAIIHVVMNAPLLMSDVTVTPEQFASPSNGEIFRTMQQLYADTGGVDIAALTDRLPDNLKEAAGDVFVYGVGAASNLESYCEIVRSNHTRRRAKTIGIELTETQDVDAAISSLLSLEESEERWNTSLKESLTGIVHKMEAADGQGGMPTGFPTLDQKMGGFHAGDLVVIGARPAVGKTALMLNIARSVGQPVQLISGEQAHEQISQRLISAVAHVPGQKFRSGDFDEQEKERVAAAAVKISKMPLYIYDEPAPTMSTVRRVSQAAVHKHGVKMVMVDYLQRMTPETRGLSRAEQVGKDVQALKNMARRLNVCVVVLAQVARKVDERDDKVPQMSDMSDSSEIEKEADVIWTIYREGAYVDIRPPRRDFGVLSIRKNRHGPKGDLYVEYIGDSLQFVEKSPTS